MAEKSKKVREYTSDDVNVTFDVKRCIHAEECVTRLSEVFDLDKRPWVQPDRASADAVAETIHHCPTGALHYDRKDGGTQEPIPEKNTVQLVIDGPLYVRGDVHINEELTDTRVALCRCGISENKPFCDNSHIEAGFKASGMMAEQANDTDGDEELTVITIENGPVKLAGNFEILDADGDVMFTGNEGFLCRCGGSQNKPFCDGTHSKIGFTAE